MKRSTWRQLVTRWLPLLLLMVAIYLISDQSSQTIPKLGVWDLFVKKGAHFSAYVLFYVLALRATRSPWIALGLSIAYAIGDEYHQTFVIGRHGTFVDVLIDAAGALVAHVSRRWWLRSGIGRKVTGVDL
jgi:VanZ family protein